MNLADAFAQLDQEPEPLGTQVPRGLSTEAPKSLGTQAPKSLSARVPKSVGAQVPKNPGTQAPRLLGTQGTGKSSHPDFEAFKVYLRTATKRAAARKYEDETDGEGDFSELVEKLLAEYLST
jgi:hypothetical protein